MRVTYLTGQSPASVDLGPVIVQGASESLPPGVQGQFIGYGAGGVPIAVDAPSAGESYDDTPLTTRVSALEEAPGPAWEDVTDKPTSFAPAAHGHTVADVSGLEDALGGKAEASHTHSQGDISGLTAALVFLAQPFLYTPRVRPYPAQDRHQSYWATWGAGTATAPANTDAVRARPWYVHGLNVQAVRMGIQGTITPGRIVELGVYASNDEGMPGLLLRMASLPVIDVNSALFDFTANQITPAEHNGRIWVGWALNGSTGGFQWQIAGASPMANAEIGIPGDQFVNAVNYGLSVRSSNLIVGGVDAVRTWPATYGDWLRDRDSFPSMSVTLQRPPT